MCINCCNSQPRVHGVMDFILRFQPAERVAIRTSTDPMVRDFIAILADQRLTVINCNTASVIDSMHYLEQVGLINDGRADAIME